jgi:hypothetical protein
MACNPPILPVVSTAGRFFFVKGGEGDRRDRLVNAGGCCHN